jgi:hypothetical protein
MQRLPRGTRIIEDNLLVRVWRLPNGDCRAQGKRVTRDCPLSADERRQYVKELGRAAIFTKWLMRHRGIGFAEAWTIIKAARGYEQRHVA